MAAYNKFNATIQAVMEKKINFSADTLKAMLTNVAPVPATDAVKADLTEIAAGNGYAAGGPAVAATGTLNVDIYELTQDADVSITAAGGDIGPARYVAIYSDTATNKDLIGWYDYDSTFTILDGETLTLKAGAFLFVAVQP